MLETTRTGKIFARNLIERSPELIVFNRIFVEKMKKTKT